MLHDGRGTTFPEYVGKEEHAAHLDTLIMQLQTIPDTSAENFADFRTVPILPSFTFHPTFLMDDPTLDDAISDSFADDILCVLFGIQVKFQADITQ